MSSRISAHDALHHATFKPLGDDVYKLKPGLNFPHFMFIKVFRCFFIKCKNIPQP